MRGVLLKTVAWFRVELYGLDAFERWVSNTGCRGRIDAQPLRAITLELPWSGELPGPADEVCVTDLSRTSLERVEWWPTQESGPLRVLRMQDIYEGYQESFDEAVQALRDVGAFDPYAASPVLDEAKKEAPQ